MMPRCELTPQDGTRPSILQRKSRAGSAAFAAFTGLAVLGVGGTAAALVGIHSTPALASSVCQALPTAPSSPAPGPTPSLTPGGGASVPASASAAAASSATQLCVTVTAVTGTVQPGQPAQYKIDVEPTGGAATDVTVQVSASPSSFPAPTFTVCGAGDGTQTCTLGAMKANNPTELQAQDAVPSSASDGSVTLTAKVTGVASGATTQGSVSGTALVRVVAPPPTTPTTPSKSPSPTPTSSKHSHHHNSGSSGHSGGSGSGQNSGSGTNSDNGLGTGLGPGTTSPGSYLAPLTGLSGTGSGSDPSGLFPTINPSPSASGTGSAPGATSGGHDPYHPTAVADVLPLNNGLVGGQVAGLVVLAAGIIIAVVRVSVRKPRTQDKQ